MNSMDRIAKDLYDIMSDKSAKGPKPYDTKAEVVREDPDNADILYVHIPGGVAETPVQKTISADVGDTVTIHVAGNTARITGNITAPPTDDKKANIAINKVVDISNYVDKRMSKLQEDLEDIEEAIDEGEFDKEYTVRTEHILSSSNTEVIPYPEGSDWSDEYPEYIPGYYYWSRNITIARKPSPDEEDGGEDDEDPIDDEDEPIDDEDEEGDDEEYEEFIGEPYLDLMAQTTAEVQMAQESTNNHFWHNTTGAYVTKANQAEYLTTPTDYAIRLTANGILQYLDDKLLTSWTGSGVAFYRSSDQNTPMATFGSNGISFDSSLPFIIGNSNSYVRWSNVNGTWKIQIAADEILFGNANLQNTLSSMDTDIASAQSTANSASTTAGSAYSIATTANSTANSASSTASSASSTASAAYSAASTLSNYVYMSSGGLYIKNTSSAGYICITSSGIDFYQAANTKIMSIAQVSTTGWDGRTATYGQFTSPYPLRFKCNIDATDQYVYANYLSSNTVNTTTVNAKVISGAKLDEDCAMNRDVITTQTGIDISIASGTTNLSGTANITMMNYYPLGVVGVDVVTGGIYSRGAYLTGRTYSNGTGSCTVNARVYNPGSAKASSVTVHVLWLKVTAT